MTILDITLISFFGSLFAGVLGSLSGLGGGIVILPLLVWILNVDIHYAIGASLIAVIATSTASSCSYVKQGYTNIRLAIFLEIATTIGAVLGVAIGMKLETPLLFILFGIFLIYCGLSSFIKKQIDKDESLIPPTINENKTFPLDLKLNGQYPSSNGNKFYKVRKVPLGFFIMFNSGILSGLLGIGSGALKVLALDHIMGLPFKVSTTTSNFMMGVTAAASLGLYMKLGYIDPILSFPIAIGVTIGAWLGTFLLAIISVSFLRQLFGVLVIGAGVKMILEAVLKL